MSSSNIINAIRLEREEDLTRALTGGDDVNAIDDSGDIAMIVAIRYDNLRAVQRLIDHGADVNHKDRVGNTALFIALRCHRADAVAVLLEKGARMDVEDTFGLTPWDYAGGEKNKGLFNLMETEREKRAYNSAVEKQKRLKEIAKKHKFKLSI